MSTMRYHVMVNRSGTTWETYSVWDALEPAKAECDKLQRATSAVLYEVWDDEAGDACYTP